MSTKLLLKRDLPPIYTCHMAKDNTVMDSNKVDFGRMLKRQRIMMSLTLADVANMSGVSASHIGRIEGGKRFPSARVLKRLAKPLGFEENELFALAGYLSPQPSGLAEESPDYINGQLEPYVARVLSREPANVQRAAIGILSILKSLTRGKTENKEVSK